MVVSSVTTPSVASSISSTTCAMRMWRRAMTTLIFSAISRVLPLRRMPAVSMKIYSVPWCITAWSTESRVVPAMGETIARSVPTSALSRVDLPTFGRPMIATLMPAGAGGAVPRRYREHGGNAESEELVGQAVAHLRVDLVDRERNGLTEPLEHLGEVAVAAGDFGAPVHQEDDVVGGFQDEFGLAEDLPRDVLLVVHHDAAGIDHLEAPAVVFGSPMYTVARDAGFVPDDGAPLSCDAVEKSGLSYVGPAHDDYRGNGIGHEPS